MVFSSLIYLPLTTFMRTDLAKKLPTKELLKIYYTVLPMKTCLIYHWMDNMGAALLQLQNMIPLYQEEEIQPPWISLPQRDCSARPAPEV